MAPFGYVSFRIDSSLPPAEVAVRLAAAVEPFQWVRWSAGPPARPFEGEVEPTEFRVSRIAYDRRPTYVVAEGRVDPIPCGSAVEGTVALSASGVIFAVWFLGLGGFVAVVCGAMLVRAGLAGHWRAELLAPAGLFLVGWAFLAGLFRLEVRWSLAALREVVGVGPGEQTAG